MATNPYLQVVESDAQNRKSQLRATVSDAALASPDAVAESRRVAKALNLPAEVVDQWGAGAKAQLRVDEIDRATQTTPTLRQKYTDADFAKLAHDDDGPLATIENLWRGIGQSTVRVGAGAGRSVFTLGGGNRGERALNDPLLRMNAFLRGKTPEAYRAEIYAKDKSFIDYVRRNENFDSGYRPGTSWEDVKRNPLKAVPFALEQGVVSAPDMAAIGINAPMYALSLTGQMSQNRAQNDNRQNATLGDMAVTAPAAVAISYLDRLGLGEMLGLGGAATATSLKGAALQTGKAALVEGGTEAVQQVTQDVAEGAGTKKGLKPGQVADNALAAAVGGAGFGGAVRAVTSTAEVVANRQVERQAKVETAIAGADTLDALAQSAQASKLRERSPEDFKAFVKDAAEDLPVKDVYVPAETFAQAMQTPEGQQALQAMPEVAAQVTEAASTGRDIRIPVEDFATYVAGTPAYAQLADQIKVEPEGLTRAEAQDAVKTQTDNLRQEFTQVLAEKEADAAFRDSMKRVTDSIKAQLDQAQRFTSDVNSRYAELAGRFYSVQAARLNITPEEFAAQYPLRVTAGNGAQVGGLFDQLEMRPREVGAPGDLGRSAREETINGATISYSAVKGGVMIDAVSVEPKDRKQGRARRALETFVAEADRTGTPLFLTAEPLGKGGASKSALTKFYKSLGFVENTGKNKAFDGPMAGMVRQPQTLKQAAKGTFDPKSLTIALNKNADLSTFLHELGHFHLEVLADLAARPDAPAELVKDMDTLLTWFKEGMTLDQWRTMSLEEQRPYHEKFARGYEAYLFEGKAPSTGLRKLFQRFSAWLVNVYRDIANLGVDLSDDVRNVMDRLVATRTEIAEAEVLRGFANPFTEKPEGMTDDEWRSLNAQAADATLDAQDRLQARTLRDMQWLEGARSRELRRLQREAKDARKVVKEQVTAEVMAEPINRARRFLSHGELDGQPVEGVHKLNLNDVKDLFPAIPEAEIVKALGTGKYGYLSKDGASPDVIAEMFGYTSGQGLVHHLLNDEPYREKIQGLTDQRMIEEYGDLVDADSLSRAADEAIHNDARMRFMASAIAALDKSVGDKATLLKSTRLLAEQAIGRQRIRDLRPDLYTAASARAGRAVLKALKGGDVALAAEEMRKQLYNAQAAKAALNAQAELRKAESFFDRVLRGKEDDVAKRRNMDLVNAARAVLDAFGYGRADKDPAGYMALVKEYDAILYGDVMPWVEAALATAPRSRDARDTTFDEFNAMRDTVAQLYDMARRSQQMRREGELVDLSSIASETASDLPEGYGPYAEVGKTTAVTKGQEIKTGLLGALALLRRVEDWSLAKGARFHRNIFQPLSDASLEYRRLSNQYRTQLRDMLAAIKPDLKPNRIEAPELNYTFGAGTGGGGLAELIGALRHTGNASNLEKMLVGRGWGSYSELDGSLDTTRWQAFLDRMHRTGVLQKRHWDYVQAEWNLHEEVKPLVQSAHRAVYGRYFTEIEAQAVETPFGSYAGGYVPATTDPRIVDEKLMREDEAALLGGSAGSFMFPSVANGFTKARNANYAQALALDLTLAGQQVDAALRFATLAEPVRDTLRLLKRNELASKLRSYDPTAQSDLLLPWLRRVAAQQTVTPTQGKGGRMIDGAFAVVRQRAVMSIMFGNLSNTLQNVTGLAPAALRTGKRNMLNAVWQTVRAPAKTVEMVTEASPFMADRMGNQMREMADNVKEIVENRSALEKAQEWSVKHTYFLQHALQSYVDTVVWTAAYNKAVERGDARPVAYADSVVRTTQGSVNPVDVSRFETGPAWAKLFTTFSGYFITQGNLVGTEFAKAKAAKSPAAYLNLYMLGVLAPAFGANLIATALRGGYEDKDEDGSLIDDLLVAFGLSQVNYIAGAVPVAGPIITATANRAAGVTTDSSLSVSPVVSITEGAIGAPFGWAQIVQGKGDLSKTVKDTASLVTLATGLPVTLVARPAGYAADVAEGDVNPTGPVDVVRGGLTGSASPESKR
ncbi:hypothetical protein [Asticcacaulis sp.]|uniref:hypothetical protein n=1 Tax=Asticcacaulis sp. TaxID=1872648 RepID=UPI0031D76414